MAKKKAAPSRRPAKPKISATTKKTKQQPAKREPAAAANSSAAKSQRPFSNALIGVAAGEVWQSLSAKNGQTLAALKKSVDSPGDHVIAAIGWLAREDKLAFESSGRSIKITLR